MKNHKNVTLVHKKNQEDLIQQFNRPLDVCSNLTMFNLPILLPLPHQT